MEIRKDPASAKPEEIIRLGGKGTETDLNEILILTDDFFMGLAERTEPTIIADMGRSMCYEM
jgi:hypothetical protein